MVYTVRQGESISDVALNGTGSIDNLSAILEANGFDSWTPDLQAGQEVIIPDSVVLQPNVKNILDTYPANNNSAAADFMIQVLAILNGLAPGANELMDKDGNIYHGVIVGTQMWLIENLKVTKYADGTPIQNAISAIDWVNASEGAYCWYNNDIANKASYGALFNYNAVNHGRPDPIKRIKYGFLYNDAVATKNGGTGSGSIAPLGWSVPSVQDVIDLYTPIGDYWAGGGPLKETGLTYWDSPNTGATNSTKFYGRAGGYRSGTGSFYDLHSIGHFGLSSGGNYHWSLRYNSAGVDFGGSAKEGNALRFVKNSTSLTDGQSGTMTDYDGNVYQTICIGTKEWTTQNFIGTHFNDGTSIQEVTGNTEWGATTDPAYCAYNNDINNALSFVPADIPENKGIAYIEKGGIQEIGWKVPLKADWQKLLDFLLSGGKLKEMGQAHWLGPNTGATDDYGFKALPGGYRDYSDGAFRNLGRECYLWVSDGVDEFGNYSHLLKLVYDSANGSIEDQPETSQLNNGFSIRLVKDLSTDDDMKYNQNIDIVADDDTVITTTLTETQVPYAYLLEDSAGIPIGGWESIQNKELIGGVWVITLHSSVAYSGAKLKIIY